MKKSLLLALLAISPFISLNARASDLEESLNDFNCTMQSLSPVGDKSVCGGSGSSGAKRVRAQNDPPGIRWLKRQWRSLMGPTVRRMSMDSPIGCNVEAYQKAALTIPDAQECSYSLAYDLNFTNRSGSFPLTKQKLCSYYACDIVGIDKIQNVIEEQGLRPIEDLNLFFGCEEGIAI